MVLKNFLLAFMIFFLQLHLLQAATTGKIAGRIIDSETGKSLPGVNIIIEGTVFGAAADAEGRFFILNVPVGRYQLQANAMGYTPQTQPNVVVTVDQTSEVNFKMIPSVLEGDSVVVVDNLSMIEKTLTQSKTTIKVEELDNSLPVSALHEIVETAPGVFQGYIRGGRKYESKTLVDGVDISDTYFSGGTGAFGSGDVGHNYQGFRRSELHEMAMGNLPASAVQELDVLAGTFTAEYPTASAGIVNMVTKSGGRNYAGKLFIRGTPSDRLEHFGSNPYYMRNSLIKDGDTLKVGYLDEKLILARSQNIKDQRAAQLFTWNENLARDQYYYDPDDSVGLGRSFEIEGTLSGPIPFLEENGSFFLSAGYQDIRTSALPFDTDQRVTGILKLNYNLNPEQRFTIYGQLNDGGKLFNFVNWKFNPRWLYYMEGAPRYKDLSWIGYAKWTHTLSVSSFYEIQISQANKSSWIGYPDDNGDGYSGLDESGDFIDFDSREEYLKYIGGVTKTDEKTGITYIDWTTVDGYVENWLNEDGHDTTAILGPNDPHRTFFYSAFDPGYMENKINFWGTGGTFRSHYPAALYSRTTRNVTTLKADFTSQITFNHQIKTGAQFRLHEVDVDHKQAEAGGAGHLYPMEAFHLDQHTFYPKEFAFYLQDRIEYKGMIVNIGARMDGYDNDTQRFINDFHPWNYLKDELGEITELQPQRGDNVGWQWYFSPRVGVSHPVSDQMAMHYSFGQFVQYPNFVSLYQDYNFTNYKSSPSLTAAWPDQEPMRSTAYEMGLQWALFPDVALDAVVYYRDVENYTQLTWRLTPYKGPGVNFLTSWGHADSRGIELTLEKRASHGWSGRVSYAYSYIKAAKLKTGNDASQRTTFTSALDSINYSGFPSDLAVYYPYREENIVLRSTSNPLAGGYDRTHRFSGTFLFMLPFNVYLTAIGNAMSGFKYFPTENTENDPWFDISPKLREGPWNYWLNLRLSWERKIGSMRVQPFAEMRNVTNKKNILAYNNTPFNESYDQTIFELGRDGQPDTGDEQDPEGYWRVPFDWLGRPLYGSARQILVGLEIGF